MNAKEHRMRGLERKAERQKKKKNRKHDQIYRCLPNRAVELHYPGAVINRAGEVEQRHNSASPPQSWCLPGTALSVPSLFPLLVTVTGSLYSPPVPLSSPTPGVFFSPAVSVPDSVRLLCSAGLMPLRGQMSRSGEVFRHPPPPCPCPRQPPARPSTPLCASTAVVSVFQSSISLSISPFHPPPPSLLQPWNQFPSVMGLSETYKWHASVLSVSLCLFSSGECHILTLSKVPLLQTRCKLPSIFSFSLSPHIVSVFYSHSTFFIGSLQLAVNRAVLHTVCAIYLFFLAISACP